MQPAYLCVELKDDENLHGAAQSVYAIRERM